MPVVFLCPACSSQLRIGRRKIGHVVKCPKCDAPLRVPELPTAMIELPEPAEKDWRTEPPTLPPAPPR